MISESILIDFIMDNHTPIRSKLILEAIEGVLTYNVLDIVPRVEEIILSDTMDTQMKVSQIKTELIDICKEILKTIGIIPYEDVDDFVSLSKIIIAMDKSVNDYYPDYIFDSTLLRSDEDSDLDKLHSVVKLIESLSELEFYNVIHSVYDTTVTELITILDSKIVPDIESDDPIILTRYKKFIKGVATGPVFEYIKIGGAVGQMTAGSLMSIFTDAIVDIPPPDRAFAILSAVLITTTPDSEVLGMANDWANYMTDTDAELAMVESTIARLYSEFTQS